MSIADDVTNDLIGTSDLKKMFGAFCCRIFAYRDEILSPLKEDIAASASMPSKPSAKTAAMADSQRLTVPMRQRRDRGLAVYGSVHRYQDTTS